MQQYRRKRVLIRLESQITRSRTDISGANPPLQVCFVSRREGGGDHGVTGGESDLVSGDCGELLCDGRIHLIADGEQTQLLRRLSGSRGDGMQENPVESAVVIPPGGILSKINGTFEVALGGSGRPSRLGHVERHNL